MRFNLVLVFLFVSVCNGAEDTPRVDGKLDGQKVTFPAKSIAEGVKATVTLLESCHDLDDGTVPYTLADLKKAEEGNHVRFVFPKPIKVFGGKVEVSMLVFTQPTGRGVFWLRAVDNRVQRYTKFEFKQGQAFEAWLRQAEAAN